MPKWTIIIKPSAQDSLDRFKKYDQTIILCAISDNLSYEPFHEARNRKQLNDGDWELRVGRFRVFYKERSKHELIVDVIGVGDKGRKTTGEIR